MARSIKKGPFVDTYLYKKAEEAKKNTKAIQSLRPGHVVLRFFQILLV